MLRQTSLGFGMLALQALSADSAHAAAPDRVLAPKAPHFAVIGPKQTRVDLSLAKLTPINERVSLEFRAEFYNLSNTPVFRPPENDINEGSFGEIERTRGGPRVIQLGLKLRF
jgi:hypothetical protein